MMRLGGQVLDLIQACAEGRLAEVRVHWADDHALTVVLAANGYPGTPGDGQRPSTGSTRLPETSSRAWSSTPAPPSGTGPLVANGGRVLNVTARGDTLREARDRAYAMVDGIDRPGGSSAAATSAGGRSMAEPVPAAEEDAAPVRGRCVTFWMLSRSVLASEQRLPDDRADAQRRPAGRPRTARAGRPRRSRRRRRPRSSGPG